ncbi:TRAF-interacting protein with FHA domain-containing protein A isoform 1-T2 [Aulostomus maculatus]
MSASEKIETEEDLLTCLYIKLYHPQAAVKAVFQSLAVGTKSRHQAAEPLRLGRDSQTCTFTLADTRVSRKHLSLHAYRTPHSPEMLFTIQNLSEKLQLLVNSTRLGFLERMDLPDKALIRFGEYEMVIIREGGEAKGSFEVELEVLAVPPSRESCTCVPSMEPIMESGSQLMSRLPTELQEHGPLETDETLEFT